MNRKLAWNAGYLENMEYVFKKAESNESINAMLRQLEQLALTESRNNCGMFGTDDGPLTPKIYDSLSDENKEYLIFLLSKQGITDINFSANDPMTITIKLSSSIQQVLGCTFLYILDCLEKLDGTLAILSSKVTLELQVPAGKKQRLFQWELMVGMLYPWISICESSSMS